MTEFAALHGLAEKLIRYSTPFGNIWVALTFLCRLIPLATIGDGAYGDEQDSFECITTQPGCSQMCYNLFAPISHIRFWGMQILILCFPTLIFSSIAANYNSKFKLLEARVSEGKKACESHSTSDYVSSGKFQLDEQKLRRYKKKTRRTEDDVEEIIWAPGMRLWYIVHLFAKLVLEVFGFYCLYLLQANMHHHEYSKGALAIMWTIPFSYRCTFGDSSWALSDNALTPNLACVQDKEVPCWVSRPYEKQVFLIYMGVMSILSILIVFLDFLYVVHKVSVKKLRQRKKNKDVSKDLKFPPIAEEPLMK